MAGVLPLPLICITTQHETRGSLVSPGFAALGSIHSLSLENTPHNRPTLAFAHAAVEGVRTRHSPQPTQPFVPLEVAARPRQSQGRERRACRGGTRHSRQATGRCTWCGTRGGTATCARAIRHATVSAHHHHATTTAAWWCLDSTRGSTRQPVEGTRPGTCGSVCGRHVTQTLSRATGCWHAPCLQAACSASRQEAGNACCRATQPSPYRVCGLSLSAFGQAGEAGSRVTGECCRVGRAGGCYIRQSSPSVKQPRQIEQTGSSSPSSALAILLFSTSAARPGHPRQKWSHASPGCPVRNTWHSPRAPASLDEVPSHTALHVGQDPPHRTHQRLSWKTSAKSLSTF